MVPFESMGTVSYSHTVATMAVSSAVSTQYTNVTESHPFSHRSTSKTAFMHNIARQKLRTQLVLGYSSSVGRGQPSPHCAPPPAHRAPRSMLLRCSRVPSPLQSTVMYSHRGYLRATFIGINDVIVIHFL